MADVDGYATGQVSWVDLVTTDPAAAREFYRALFGWDYEIGPAETGHYTMCLLGGRAAAGMNGDPSERLAPAWTTYFSVDDLDGVFAGATALGATPLMGPIEITGQGGVAALTDPAGAVVGMWRPGGHPGAQVRDEPGALVWHELVSRDLGAAVTFYGELFGYTWEDVDTGPGGPEYRTFALDGTTVGGMMAMDDGWPADIPAHWMPYFGVSDADTAADAAERAGGQVSVPPTTTGFGRFAVLTDPQGAVFTVMDQSTRS